MKLAACFLTGLFVIAHTALAADSPIAAKLTPLLEKEAPGIVTVVANRDKVLDVQTLGLADIDANTPMKPDTIVWIASMTKPITGSAVMMMVEEGKLSLDDPIGKHIPELAHLKTSDGTEHVVTIRHILTHTSGMSDVPAAESKECKTLAELMPNIPKRSLRFVPGSKWEYNQAGINTAGRLVEIASGKPLDQFLQERLFTPLGMKDTTFYPTEAQLPRLSKGYALKDGKFSAVPNFFLNGKAESSHDRFPAANGGLFSTGPDYARFLQMVLNNGTLDGKQYLKPETVKTMLSVQSGNVKTGFTPGNAWGVGWCLVREPQGVSATLSPGSAGHGGAWGTQAWIDPQKGMAYVLICQRANFPNSDDSNLRKAFQETAANAFK